MTSQEKEIRVINTGNEETKLSLFTADMTVCVQNSTELKQTNKKHHHKLQAKQSEFINKSTIFLD